MGGIKESEEFRSGRNKKKMGIKEDERMRRAPVLVAEGNIPQ